MIIINHLEVWRSHQMLIVQLNLNLTGSLNYQLLDIRMHNQLLIKQTQSIFKQTHSFVQNPQKGSL